MTYCCRCGAELPKDALYCSKCGTKAGFSATPSDELRESLTRMSQEMEKAFLLAAKEMQDAFKAARTNMQKTIYKEPIVCPSCGEKNAGTAIYCLKCGKILEKQKAEKPEEDT